jgi:hypothetical protein
MEVKAAERRVETAVCAFGGYLDPLTREAPQDESSPTVAATSIFRLRGDALKRQKYEAGLPKRYTLSGSVVSWEVRRYCERSRRQHLPHTLPLRFDDSRSKRILLWRFLRRSIRGADKEARRRDEDALMDLLTTRMRIQRRRRPIPWAISRTIAPAS